MSQLDLTADVVDLATAVVDTPSVSGSEGRLADAVEAALRTVDHLDVERDGNVVLARTSLGRGRRVVLAGHLDTVPAAGNLPSRREGDLLYGCGTTDMKGGLAVMLRLAATLTEPVHDLTFVFYDCEEVEAIRNGLGRLARSRPEAIRGDFAILLEPSNGVVEAGCQGTLRIEVNITGKRAHTARSWLGVNAIHAAGEVLARLQAYEPRRVDVEGCEYREGLSAVRISGGVVGNVVPDACTVTVNYRYAPDLDETQAVKHMAEVFDGFDVDVIDSAPPAPPGLSDPAVAEFVAATGAPPVAKYGWTDVARFAAIGVPAVNFGPGDPNLAHTLDEHVDVKEIVACERALRTWLTGAR